MKKLLIILSTMASLAGCATPFQFIPFDHEIPSMEVITNIVDNKLSDYVKIDDLKQVHFKEMAVTNLTIDGKKPSLEGHKHSVTDIVDWSEVQFVVPTIEAKSFKIDGKDVAVRDDLANYIKKSDVSSAASTAITGINGATTIEEIQVALTNFLHTLVITPAP